MSRDQPEAPADDESIPALVARLSRPAPGGRRVIERAAIMAEGAESAAILDWLAAESWVPEDVEPAGAGASTGGLHGMRREAQRASARPRPPRRYLSPR